MNVRRDSKSQRTGVSSEMQGADAGAGDALVRRQGVHALRSSCWSREMLWPSGC